MGVESLALLGHGPEANGEGSCRRGHTQGPGALPGREEDHLALFSLAHPPAGNSHMKVPENTSRGPAQPPHDSEFYSSICYLINNKLLLSKLVRSEIIYYTAVLGK